MRMMVSRTLMLGVVATAAALGTSAAPAWAATGTVYNVNTIKDGNLANLESTTCTSSSDSPAKGKCSLRAAIEAAGNVLTGDVTINVPKGTYTLTVSNPPRDTPAGAPVSGDTELLVSGESDNPNEVIDIDGAGASSTIVDANDTDRAFEIETGTTASISGMTIENGRPGGLEDVTTCPEEASTEADGGGILGDSGSNLTLSDDLVTDNIAAGGGGGIDADGKLLAVNHTTVSDNQSCQSPGEARGGGGIDVTGGGTLNVNFSVISGNCADPTGDDCASPNADGGGIEEELNPASFNIRYTTISGNSASGGGGIGADEGGSWSF